jgi:hypothetical protein
MDFIPCFLCGAKLEMKTSKRGKPYFVCDPCGVQLFIRRPNGIEGLRRLMRERERLQIPFDRSAHTLAQIQALLNEIQGLKSQIEKSEGVLSFLFEDEDSRRARKLLKKRLENAFAKLRQVAEENSPIPN